MVMDCFLFLKNMMKLNRRKLRTNSASIPLHQDHQSNQPLLEYQTTLRLLMHIGKKKHALASKCLFICSSIFGEKTFHAKKIDA